jgi:hypothetical protein
MAGKVPKTVKTAEKLLLVNGLEQSCRGSDSNVELNDTQSKQTSSPKAVFGW